MGVTSLSSLPHEVLATILEYLDITSTLAVYASSKRLKDMSDDPSVWRKLCQREYRFWDDRKKFRTLLANPSSHNWKNILIERVKSSKAVRRSIQELVDDPVGRSDRIQDIVESGYGSKDALLAAYEVDSKDPNFLAQRYWSWMALECLHRTTAVKEWDKIKFQDNSENVTERALAAMDMFILGQRSIGDIDDIFDSLQSYVDSVRKAHPHIDEQTPRQKACTIAAHLRERQLLGLDDGARYYSLDNMFLGVALYSPRHNSQPLLSSVIYCYVCRQFGLRAQPCSFPVHVHSVVDPPEGMDLDGNPLSRTDTTTPDVSTEQMVNRLYMDPFNHAEPVPVSRLLQQLRLLGAGIQEPDLSFALQPAPYRDLIVRSATNIINSVLQHLPQHTFPIKIESAAYAARFALATFPTNPELVSTYVKELTQTFLHSFDHDIHLFRSHIMPLTTGLPDQLAYRNLSAQLLQSELERPTPKRRSDMIPAPSTLTTPPDPPASIFSSITGILGPSRPRSSPSSPDHQIKYKVGQVFRHRRAGYLAVIYGWDTICAMSDRWITVNNVDSLPRGRHQPFYNSFVADDGSSRYVAQENIMLVGQPDENTGNNSGSKQIDVEAFGIQIGKWFRRFDYERGVFVSNLKDMYPED